MDTNPISALLSHGIMVVAYRCLCLSFLLYKFSMRAKSLQLCPVLFDPMNCSSPGPSVHGTLQARILEHVPNSFFKAINWDIVTKPVSTSQCLCNNLLTDPSKSLRIVPGIQKARVKRRQYQWSSSPKTLLLEPMKHIRRIKQNIELFIDAQS